MVRDCGSWLLAAWQGAVALAGIAVAMQAACGGSPGPCACVARDESCEREDWGTDERTEVEPPDADVDAGGEVPDAGSCPGGMCLVPAGRFFMGCNDGSGECPTNALDDDCLLDWENPCHAVDMPAFEIDRTEVTAGQYAVFMASPGATCINPGGTSCDPGRGVSDVGTPGREEYPRAW